MRLHRWREATSFEKPDRRTEPAKIGSNQRKADIGCSFERVADPGVSAAGEFGGVSWIWAEPALPAKTALSQ